MTDERPVPQWTQRMYERSSGRDHLGLASVAQDRLLPDLSPGIVVQTVHPRYWSFYAFLLTEFWDRDLPRTRAAYREFHRPREAAFVAGMRLLHPHHQQVVGSERTDAQLAANPGEFDPSFDYIQSSLGGYSANYAGMLYQSGLVQPAGGPLKVDAPTPNGREVGLAFKAAVEATAYYRDYFPDARAPIPADALIDYAKAGCLCLLAEPGAPDRPGVRDAFLHSGPGDAAQRRRGTLRMILNLARDTDGHALSEGCFRQLVHYRSCSHDDGTGSTWAPTPELLRVARRWRLFQVHEYYAFALNRLWKHLADWGAEVTGGARSMHLDELWAYLETALTTSALSEAFEFSDPVFGPSSTVDAVASWAGMQAAAGGDLDAPWSRAGPFDEHELYLWGRQDGTEAETVPGMMLMLLLGFVRVGSPGVAASYPEDFPMLGWGGAGRLAMPRFLEVLRRDVLARRPWRHTARWVYEGYLINQHQRVAVGKLPDDTYRFRREGDRLWFTPHDNVAVMPNSRFAALTGAMHELGLAGQLTAPQHPLSPAGQQLLLSGDLPTSS